MSTQPSPVPISSISVYASLEPTQPPALVFAYSGIYDPSTDPATLTVLIDGSSTLVAQPFVGRVYGIVFTDQYGTQTMIGAKLTGLSISDEGSPGWLKFEQIPHRYNLLTWLCYGDLASDDLMWSVECPALGLANLLEYPLDWVTGLNDLAGVYPSNGSKITIQDHFTIQMVADSNNSVSAHQIHIEGISGTGILRVVASNTAAQRLTRLMTSRMAHQQGALPPETSDSSDWIVDPEYWDSVYERLKDEVPTMIYDIANARAFGHLRIYKKGKSDERHLWIATYLLARLVDPEGYAAFLKRFQWEVITPSGDSSPSLPQPSSSTSTVRFGSRSGSSTSAARPTSTDQSSPTALGVITKGAVDVAAGQSLVFTYASYDGSEEECCDIQFGSTTPAPPPDQVTITLASGTVKDY